MTEGEVTVGSDQTLQCSVSLAEIDVPVKLTLSWTFSNNNTLNETSIELSQVNELDTYYLDLYLYSLNYSQTGAYSCVAKVETSDAAVTEFVKPATSLSVLTVTAAGGKCLLSL